MKTITIPCQRTAVAVLTVLAATTLAGCGLFKTSGLSGKYEPKDPDRVADRVVASVANNTYFTADAPSGTANFRATLYDKDRRQFFGPEIQLDGDVVPTTTNGDDRTTVYSKTGLPYAAGNTWTMAVQGHSATTPAAPPPLKITSPAASKDDKGNTLTYFNIEPGQPATITWTGGDPAQPVYIVLYGAPDKNGARRLFVADNPALSPTDPANFGQPIPNTGTYTIPATLDERVVAGNGSTSTRTVTVFDSPNKKDNPVNLITISVVQRGETVSGPIRFAVSATATAAAGITAYK